MQKKKEKQNSIIYLGEAEKYKDNKISHLTTSFLNDNNK
jgi:hypothetical protein